MSRDWNDGIGQEAYQNPTSPPSGSDVVEIPFRPAASGLPVEMFTLASLVQRRGRTELRTLQRLHFELLIFCTGGSGCHEVDFDEVQLVPGRVLHVRPGQVHRWILDPPYDARLVLLRALDDRGGWGSGQRVVDVDRQLDRDLQAIFALADPDFRSTPLSVLSLDAVRDLLVSLVGLRRTHPNDATRQEIIYNEFERLLRQTEPPPRSVEGCARILGCSTRTLARACQSVRGVEPKILVDKAVGLEAQRRLSEPGSSATTVAESLGFAELSHFTRFFKRVTGETPSAFAATFRVAGVGSHRQVSNGEFPGQLS